MPFKLPTDLATRIAELAADLDSTAQELRDEWSGKSERWQEGDTGQNADTWIEELAELSDTLSNLEPEPTG
jgi:uncharacterized protein YukE